MHLGFASMNTAEDLPPDELGRALEARGYESVWFGEHSHIPVERRTPYPAGGEMPDMYRRMMDPLLSLLMAASATTRLRIGTGVALPLEHDLFQLAKQVATLDRLSGGRLLFGVGAGWNREELANHRAIPWAARYRALREAVGALRSLWCDEESSFHGDFVAFDPVWSFPKPLQSPHPPLLAGMSGRVGVREAIAWADAWMPMDVALGDVAEALARFRALAAEAGRPDLPVTIVTFRDPDPDTLLRLRDLGVERVVIGANREGWDDPATTLGYLDRYAELVPRVA